MALVRCTDGFISGTAGAAISSSSETTEKETTVPLNLSADMGDDKKNKWSSE